MTSLKQLLKNFFSEIPSLDLEPTQEDDLIENIARTVSKWNMELPVLLFGSGFEPASTIVTYTTLLPLAPVLEIFGIRGYEYSALFSKKENVKRLMKRIEDLKNFKENK